MKRADIHPGDRIFVRPWLSMTREHWGTFHRFNKGGWLIYEPDKDSPVYWAAERLRHCCWRDVEQIVRSQVRAASNEQHP